METSGSGFRSKAVGFPYSSGCLSLLGDSEDSGWTENCSHLGREFKSPWLFWPTGSSIWLLFIDSRESAQSLAVLPAIHYGKFFLTWNSYVPLHNVYICHHGESASWQHFPVSHAARAEVSTQRGWGTQALCLVMTRVNCSTREGLQLGTLHSEAFLLISPPSTVISDPHEGLWSLEGPSRLLKPGVFSVYHR